MRFDSYLAHAEGRHIEAIGLYQWNLDLSAALMPCLSATELTLRNAIHRSLASRYGSDWMLEKMDRTPILRQADRVKVSEAIEAIKNSNRHATADRVVSELSFGFWVNLLNSNYDREVVTPMLSSTMKSLRSGRTHGDLRNDFGAIRDVRNRVAHLDPIHSFPQLADRYRRAWVMCHEINPHFAIALHKICRFEQVFRNGVSPYKERIRNQLRDEYDAL